MISSDPKRPQVDQASLLGSHGAGGGVTVAPPHANAVFLADHKGGQRELTFAVGDDLGGETGHPDSLFLVEINAPAPIQLLIRGRLSLLVEEHTSGRRGR